LLPTGPAEYLEDVGAIEVVTVGQKTFLVTSGSRSDAGGERTGGLSVFEIGADGSLTRTAQRSDASDFSRAAQLVTSLEVGQKTYVVIAGSQQFPVGPTIHAVSVFELTAAGGLELVATTPHFVAQGQPRRDDLFTIRSMDTLEVGGAQYLVTAGGAPLGLRTYTVDASGALVLVSEDEQDTNAAIEQLRFLRKLAVVPGATGATLVLTGGNQLLASATVDAQGAVSYVGAADLRGQSNFLFGSIASVVEHMGATYVVTGGGGGGAVGSTDGLNVYTVDAMGVPQREAFYRDGPATSLLDEIVSLDAVSLDGELYVVGGGRRDKGLSLLSYDAAGASFFLEDNEFTDESAALVEQAQVTRIAQVGQRTFVYVSSFGTTTQGLNIFELKLPAP